MPLQRIPRLPCRVRARDTLAGMKAALSSNVTRRIRGEERLVQARTVGAGMGWDRIGVGVGVSVSVSGNIHPDTHQIDHSRVLVSPLRVIQREEGVTGYDGMRRDGIRDPKQQPFNFFHSGELA